MFGGFLLFKQSEYAIIVLGSIWTPTYSRRDFFLLTVRGLIYFLKFTFDKSTYFFDH